MPASGATRFPRIFITFVQTHMPGVPSAWRPGAARESGRPLVEYLALSGGADDGAFGAGLLAGWTKRGDRPKFEVVTGVSAGALIAPYAFLGPGYDAQLARDMDQVRREMLATPQILAGLLGAEALAELHPPAQAHRQARRTAHAGQIAPGVPQRPRSDDRHHQSRRPAPGDLEHGRDRLPAARDLRGRAVPQVLLASASIPGVFPPVHIKVRVGDRIVEEMHVDGGPTRQVFLAPASFAADLRQALSEAPDPAYLSWSRTASSRPNTKRCRPTRWPSARARCSHDQEPEHRRHQPHLRDGGAGRCGIPAARYNSGQSFKEPTPPRRSIRRT